MSCIVAQMYLCLIFYFLYEDGMHICLTHHDIPSALVCTTAQPS